MLDVLCLFPNLQLLLNVILRVARERVALPTPLADPRIGDDMRYLKVGLVTLDKTLINIFKVLTNILKEPIINQLCKLSQNPSTITTGFDALSSYASHRPSHHLLVSSLPFFMVQTVSYNMTVPSGDLFSTITDLEGYLLLTQGGGSRMRLL